MLLTAFAVHAATSNQPQLITNETMNPNGNDFIASIFAQIETRCHKMQVAKNAKF